MKVGNITSTRRSYADACGAALALDLVGERWALLVMRELMLGPKRFNDIRAGLPGISANVLTQRLEGLEEVGVLTRHRLPPPVSAQVYELTSWGYESEPIFQALGRWAVRSPAHDPGLPLSPVSFMLSLRTMIDPVRAAGIEARVDFDIGKERFLARLAGGGIDIAPRGGGEADLLLAGTPHAMIAAIYGRRPLEALEAEGALSIEGDHALAERFVTLFPLPPKVAD